MGIYWNTFGAIGIPGSWEAGETHLGSHRNAWESIGIPGEIEGYLVSERLGKPTWKPGSLASRRGNPSVILFTQGNNLKFLAY